MNYKHFKERFLAVASVEVLEEFEQEYIKGREYSPKFKDYLKDFRRVKTVISCAFSWESSARGHEFWRNIYDNIED